MAGKMRWVFSRIRDAYLIGGLSGIFVSVMLVAAACLAAWATHVVWLIGKLASDQGVTGGQIVLGLLGTFMPPIGVIHGFMIWFGIGM